MSLVFLPLIIALGICFIPIWLFPRRRLQCARDYVVASQPTPPDVIRNGAVGYPLRIATFAPFFAWGASGNLWPAIIAAAGIGAGVYLIYALRRPLLSSLDNALGANSSATVPALIAERHGNDGRVRLLAACLTVIALTGLITAEAFAAATLAQPIIIEGARSVYLLAGGILVFTGLYTICAGHSGAMQSVQLQLGLIYLALFGSTALLLYFLVSDVSAMPPHGSFAVLFIAAVSVFTLFHRRFKFVDNSPIKAMNGSDAEAGVRSPLVSRLLRRLEKALDTFVSIFVVLTIVLVIMGFYAFGLPAMARQGIAALQMGTGMSATALATLAVLGLLYPLADVANWQRFAALAKDTGSEPGLRSASVSRIFNSLAAEVMLLLLLMCMLGAIGVIATETPAEQDVLQTFIRKLAFEENLPATLAASLLLLGIVALALSATTSMLSASLWVLRYDLLPAFRGTFAPEQIKPRDEGIPRRCTILAGCGLCVAAFLLVAVADALLHMSFSTNTFLAVLFACWCAQLSFVPLVLACLIPGMGAVRPLWALVIVAVAAGSGIAAVILYVATGAEPWLWAAVPACLASGLVLFAFARFSQRIPQGG